ncbi:MAG: cupin domain-containing protein [Candidatus Nanopelagicales bacterium]|jgi:quercetin dioxygenase-like cupin family protein|nr:cupin domain-containing protein [Candidatus Nanopelagicales bacterium]
MAEDVDAPALTHVGDLAALIAVAPASTVSRTVLRAEGVRVVLFAFDADQELSEHTAAVPVLLQVLDGRLRVGAGGASVDLGPGGLVHIAARVPHEVLALAPSRMVLTMLDPRARAR